MTTVGYGDISPQTFRERVMAVVWMFISLVLVFSFTATMASILTAARLNQSPAIRGPDYLRQIHVGTFVIRNQYANQFTVVLLNVDSQLYVFALRESSPLREPINRVLLRKIHEPAWHDLLYHYLGNFPN
jgi:hypothetical protein